MATSYTYSNLQDAVADPYLIPVVAEKAKILNILNRAARKVISEVDLRSSKRKSTISPLISEGLYDYTAPSDLKDDAIIDIIPQTKDRNLTTRVDLKTNEYFDRKKYTESNIATVGDSSFSRILRLNIDGNETNIQITNFDSTTSPNGTWTAYSDAASLTADDSNYVEGGGSLKFNLTGSAITAGVVNSTLTAIDISDYVNNGQAIVWAYINSTTNLTQYNLEIGEDTSNYYYMVATTQADGNAFKAGWNQLRFAFVDKTTTGTPTDASVNFVRLYMVKTSGKSDDGYRFDDLVLHTGEYFDVLYYSKYPWQNSSGTYIENSTASTDYLNADTDEFDLFVLAGKMELARELRDYNEYNLAKADYENAKLRYKRMNPSERKLIQSDY